VRSWHANLLRNGPGASTAAKCYGLLRAILSTAVEDGLLAANPCTMKGAGVEPADERAIPTVGEVYALADAVHPRYRALVLTAAFAGLRRGELFGLSRSDIDPLHRTVTVSVQRQENAHGQPLIGAPKTDAGRRTIVLPADLLTDVENHLATWAAPGPDGVVFLGTKGAPLRPQVWQAEWNRARRTLGLDHLHFHDLRHVAGTLGAATGAGTKETDVPARPRVAPGGAPLPARHAGARQRHRRGHGRPHTSGDLPRHCRPTALPTKTGRP
jgi:integrase